MLLGATTGCGIAAMATMSVHLHLNSSVEASSQCEAPYLGEGALSPTFIADAAEVAVPALVNITANITDPFGRRGIFHSL